MGSFVGITLGLPVGAVLGEEVGCKEEQVRIHEMTEMVNSSFNDTRIHHALPQQIHLENPKDC